MKHTLRPLACTETLAIRNWTTGGYVIIDKRPVGPNEVELADIVPPGTLGDYVTGASGNGQVRIRVQCTKRAPLPFTAYGDLMQITYSTA